jgi:hypothetical protein
MAGRGNAGFAQPSGSCRQGAEQPRMRSRAVRCAPGPHGAPPLPYLAGPCRGGAGGFAPPGGAPDPGIDHTQGSWTIGTHGLRPRRPSAPRPVGTLARVAQGPHDPWSPGPSEPRRRGSPVPPTAGTLVPPHRRTHSSTRPGSDAGPHPSPEIPSTLGAPAGPAPRTLVRTTTGSEAPMPRDPGIPRYLGSPGPWSLRSDRPMTRRTPVPGRLRSSEPEIPDPRGPTAPGSP